MVLGLPRDIRVWIRIASKQPQTVTYLVDTFVRVDEQ
jgi:hypothetical protein